MNEIHIPLSKLIEEFDEYTASEFRKFQKNILRTSKFDRFLIWFMGDW